MSLKKTKTKNAHTNNCSPEFAWCFTVWCLTPPSFISLRLLYDWVFFAPLLIPASSVFTERWSNATSPSLRPCTVPSGVWRPTTLLSSKWGPSWSTFPNTRLRCTVWWSAAPISSPSKSPTSSASLLMRTSASPIQLFSQLFFFSPLQSNQFQNVLNLKP